MGHWLARGLLGGRENLQNRGSDSGAQVDGQVGFAIVEIIDCFDVGIGEIFNMDVVANAGPVCGGVVIALDLQRTTCA